MAQIHKNIGFSGISQFIYTALAFLLIPFAARYLGTREFGLYSVAATVGFFVGLLCDLGLTTILTLEISKKPRISSRLFSYVLGIKFVLIPVTILLLLLFLWFGKFDQKSSEIILLFSIASVLGTFSQAGISVFRGFEKMEYEALAVFIDKFISVISGIVVLVLGLGIYVFILTFLIAGIVKVALIFILLETKFIKLNIRLDYRKSKLLLNVSFLFGVSVFLAVCYNYLDIIMLSVMVEMSQVGFYAASYKLLSLTSIIPTILSAAFLPQLSVLSINKQKLSRLFLQGINYLHLFSIAMVPFIIFLAEPIINIVFGKDYSGSIGAMKILVFAAFAQMGNTFFVTLYAAVNQQKKIVQFQVVGLFVNILLNLILIPIWSYRGAAIATVATEWSIFVLIVVWAKRKLLIYKISDLLFIIKVFLAASIMTVCILFTLKLAINIILISVLAGISYFLALQSLGCLNFIAIIRRLALRYF